MENSNKEKWIQILVVTELFRRYYDKRSSEKENKILEDLDLEKSNKPDLRFLKDNAETKYIWEKISAELDLKTDVRKKQKLVYRFVAVASIAIFIAYGYYVNQDQELFDITNESPSLVDTPKTIITGTDKAILTLDDGTEIALEKGANYQTKVASSDGAQLIYNSPVLMVDKMSTDTLTNTKTSYNYLTIPRGGQFFVQLPDGTKVWLNSESQLKYPVHFIEGKTRHVELVYGEAYFEVSPSVKHKEAKFKVISHAQEVEVLGTEFNIKAYRDETNVYTTLVEGKVAVNALNKSKTLIPGEQLNLNLFDNSMESASVDVYREISWKDGVFSFKDKPLKDIMTVISRWYDIDVIFDDNTLEKITFKGSLDKKLSIEEILSIITGTTNMHYEIKNKTIILK